MVRTVLKYLRPFRDDLLKFAGKHPEYDEKKWLDIIRKTWKKMSDRGQQFALSGNIQLPETLVPIIQKAIATD